MLNRSRCIAGLSALSLLFAGACGLSAQEGKKPEQGPPPAADKGPPPADQPPAPRDNAPRAPRDDKPRAPRDDEPRAPRDNEPRAPRDNEPRQPRNARPLPDRPLPEGQVQESAEPAQSFRAKQILGTKVSIEGNVSIGIVDDLVFDDYGQVEYMIVENDGKLVTVPWEAAKFNFQERTATVPMTRQQYLKVPTYTVDQYPAYTTQPYRTQVYGIFGLTPRERRIERKLERRP